MASKNGHSNINQLGCKLTITSAMYLFCSECGVPAVDIEQASCGCSVCGRCYGILSDMYVCYAI